MRKLATIFAFAACILFASASVEAQTFGAGNIVVYRVGDGAQTLATTGNTVFLDEYTQTGAFVRSIRLPDVATTSGNRALIASGVTTSEGLLTRSVDGRFLLLTGYNATQATNTTTLPDTTGSVINRVIGRVDAAGTIDTTTALTNLASGSSPRSAASVDGVNLYATGGTGGIRFATLGTAGSSTPVLTSPSNLRQVRIFNGQLYVSTNSVAGGNTTFLGTVNGSDGSGTPMTSGATFTPLPGNPGNPGSPFSFFFANLDDSVGRAASTTNVDTVSDTLYIADESASNGTGNPSGQILKFSLIGGSYVLVATIVAPSVRGLTAVVTRDATSGTSVVTLFGSTSNSLYRFDDTTGYVATAPATPVNLGTAATIASAPAGTAFRGVELVPISPTADELMIEGRVTTAQGAPLAGVTIRLAGTEQAVTVTDADGYYSFSGIDVGGIYSVYAVRRGYSFSPNVRTFGDVQVNTVADFIVTSPRKGRNSRFSR